MALVDHLLFATVHSWYILYSLHLLRPTLSAVSLLCVVSYGDIVRVVYSFTFTFTYTFI